eukprot:11209391-Lingulodinium_polyedra.AAC.1
MAVVLSSQQPLNEASTMEGVFTTSYCNDGAFLERLCAYGADTCRREAMFLCVGCRYDRRPLRGY